MMFEKLVRIPHARVAVLIGRSGKAKSRIEEACGVSLEIDGQTGVVAVRAGGDHGNGGGDDNSSGAAAGSGAGDAAGAEAATFYPFKAVEVVTAIGRGFSPDNALTLLDGDNALCVVDLRDFVGKSTSNIERIKGRLIGEGGRARRNVESLTRTRISVYGRTVSIIGPAAALRTAADAVSSISSGSMHGAVYNKLEAANRKAKRDRTKLWEDQDAFY